jgi:transposase
MNVHSRAKTTPRSRELLVRRVEAEGWSRQQAAEAFGLSVRRVAAWLRRLSRGAVAWPAGSLQPAIALTRSDIRPSA